MAEIESAYAFDVNRADLPKCPWQHGHTCHYKESEIFTPFEKCLLCLLGGISDELELGRHR